MSEQIIVGMSGGVDSSVTTLLLKEQGNEVAGLFMKNWNEDDGTSWCTARQDRQDARSVCATLGISLHTVNLAEEYWQEVFTGFIEQYRAGATPNPDIHCNERIKFRAFLQQARQLGAERIATGHYARLRERDGEYRLCKARDADKDQSYFLYRLNQTQLAQSLFPLGELHKHAVRTRARQAGFCNHAKKDSTGICFIGERPFRDFLRRWLSPQPGPIVTPEGRCIGEHQGLWFCTLGQRQGLGIGGVRGAREAPWYVAGKDLEKNTLYVVQGHDHPLLFSRQLSARRCHWIGEPPDPGQICGARVRHRQADQHCTVVERAGTRCTLRFANAQRAVTPGQSVVLYAGEICLGGGIIDHTDQTGLGEGLQVG